MNMIKSNLKLWNSKNYKVLLSSRSNSSSKASNFMNSLAIRMYSRYYSKWLYRNYGMLKLNPQYTSVWVKPKFQYLRRSFSSTAQSTIDKNSRIESIVASFSNFNHDPDVMEISTIMDDLNKITLTFEEYEGYLETPVFPIGSLKTDWIWTVGSIPIVNQILTTPKRVEKPLSLVY